MDDYIFAVVMGIVEGITEFIPVSSTAHMVLSRGGFSYAIEKQDSFIVIIQLAAILAVLFLYRQRVTRFFDFKNEEGLTGKRAWKCLILTSLPVLTLGYLVKNYIRPFNPYVAIWGILIGGIAMLLVERYKPDIKRDTLDDITPRIAFYIGLFQCLCLWNGISRSGSTICGALILGCDRKAGAEYSFLAAVPVMVVVTGYEILDIFFSSKGTLYEGRDLFIFGLGFLISFLTAMLAITIFLKILNSHTLRPFAYYRILAAPVLFYFLT